MKDETYQAFAKALLKASPENPAGAEGVQALLKAQGLGRFAQSADRHTAELIETAELLIRMKKRGRPA